MRILSHDILTEVKFMTDYSRLSDTELKELFYRNVVFSYKEPKLVWDEEGLRIGMGCTPIATTLHDSMEEAISELQFVQQMINLAERISVQIGGVHDKELKEEVEKRGLADDTDFSSVEECIEWLRT